jgi:hypothetical protein
MKTSNVFRFGALALISLLLTTCRDSTGGDRARSGWLALQLTTPNTDDGGVLITVSGPAIDSVRTTHAHLLSQRLSASSMRVLIGGNLSAGVIGEILVPNTRQTGQYSVVVQEVASRSPYQQRALTGYQVAVVAAPR